MVVLLICVVFFYEWWVMCCELMLRFCGWRLMKVMKCCCVVMVCIGFLLMFRFGSCFGVGWSG